MAAILVKLYAAIVILPFVMSSGCSTAKSGDVVSRVQALEVGIGAQVATNIHGRNSLRLVSINLAHGRKDSLNQWLVNEEKTRQNLDDIATFLHRVDADVVALQEADGPSAWSGGFSHVAYLAEKAGFPYFVYSEHAQITMGNYGTALLSRVPVSEALGLTFTPSWPTANKGFTLAEIQWPNPDVPGEVVALDVVSVHLDFSRKSVRRSQIDELVAVLKPRKNPLLIMGDFNSEWLARKYTVDSFADDSPLHIYDVDSHDLNTYKDKRLDWILLSRDLEFKTYEIEPSVLSDHKAIVATIRLPVSGTTQ